MGADATTHKRSSSIKNLLDGLSGAAAGQTGSIEVSDIAYDSRKAGPGMVFVAITGNDADGRDYAVAAAKAGCVAVVTEKPIEGLDIPQFTVDDSRAALAHMSSIFFSEPSGKISLAGITGTNGKTTCCYMLESIYRAAGDPSGLIGTVAYRIAGQELPQTRTTPQSYDLQSIFSRMAEARVGRAAMEVSSHAIDQKRVFATEFAVKAFTNLSQDHLDYHGDVEAYFQAKASFCLAGNQPVVINSDDEYGRRLIPAVRQPVTFGGNEPADFRADDIRATTGGSEFVLKAPDGDHRLTVRIPGIFNVMNAAAAAAAARCQDAPWAAIEQGLAGLKSVPGRFERVEGAEGYTVIVDYAHTPDGLAKALESARELTSGRLISVFGCGGDRDKGKRPIMGKISVSLADVTIVTSDNPRSEDPDAIIGDVCRDLKSGECRRVADRREAIAAAIEMAGAGDLVLIAGKGHEKTQEFADRIIEFDDTAVAREEIMKAKNR